MKTKIVELRQKRAQLISEARQMLEALPDGQELEAEQRSRYDEIWAEQEKLGGQAERMEQLAAAEETLGESAGGDTRHRRPEAGGSGPAAGQDEYRRAFVSYLRHGYREMSPVQMRALQADNDTEGGYLTAPVEMQRDILKGVDNAVFIRQWATKFQVPTAEGLGVPKLEADPNDADWTTELKTGQEDNSMRFGGRELRPHPMAKRIRISRKLLRMLPTIEQFVRDRIAYKVAITQEKAFLLGDGAQKPLGVFVASALGIPTGRDVATDNTATAITMNGLINAKYALRAEYWPKARWLFHRDGVKQLAKLRDDSGASAGTGQYLWQPSVQVGQPDMLLGHPMTVSEYCPNTFTTGQYVGAFADFSHYWIADALTMDVQRLDELYSESNQVGLIIRAEADGMPVLDEAFVRVKLG